MSEELRPCPFCGGTNICTEKGINLNYCDSCSAEDFKLEWAKFREDSADRYLSLRRISGQAAFTEV